MKRNNRKQQIYEVAAGLFKDKGYTASSIRDIAEKVGLEPSSLYSHIKSKEEILINICMNTADMFAIGMDHILESHNDCIDKLDALLDLHISIAENHPVSDTVFNDEWRHLPKDTLDTFIQHRREYRKRFTNILREGMKEGRIVKMQEKTAFNLIINSTKWLRNSHKSLSSSDLDIRRKEIKSFLAKGLQINTL